MKFPIAKKDTGNEFRIDTMITTPTFRIVLDNVAYAVNDIIEPNLAIRFVGLDTSANQLLFNDSSGQIYRISYR